MEGKDMRDLLAAFNNCTIMLSEIGIKYGEIIEVSVNRRAKNRWGQCRRIYTGIANKPYCYKINISEILLDERVPIEALNNTIIHEILHTCHGCMNHGIEWKAKAALVKNKLGYDIQRCDSQEDKLISSEVTKDYIKPPKYVVRCVKCGKEIGKSRMCDLIRYPEAHIHIPCRSEFVRVK